MEENKGNKNWKGGFLTLGHFRDILAVALLVILAWKILTSDISITLESFSFTDLLSVLLAFFAMALSAAFYFKATDTSNLFYDNTYKFTKEVSEILGRIEAGFGERLKHIDEGYTGLRDKFDQIPFDLKEAKEEERKEEKHIKEQEKERNQIILDLMEKARVAGDEKARLLKELEDHSKELEHSKIELRRLQRDINRKESNLSDISSGFLKHFSKLIDGKFTPKYLDAPISILRRRFSELLKEELFDDHDVNYMARNGLLDEERKLTNKGVHVMREAIRQAI